MSKHLNYLKYINSLDFKYILNLLKPLRIGCDNVSNNAPIHTLKLINVPFTYVFTGDNNSDNIKSILANYKPKIIYDNIFLRDNSTLQLLDIYIASIPYEKCIIENIESSFFNCYLICIKKTKPRVFIFEHKGNINTSTNSIFTTIINQLNNLNRYNIYYKSLNTKDYGIPQSRERIFIIGIDKTCDKGFKFPKKIQLDITVEDILETYDNIDPKFAHLTQHKTQLLNDLQEHNKVVDLDKNWSINLNVSSYKKCTPMLDICPGLLAGNGGDCIFYLSSIGRRYTPREYLNLQGFSEFNQDVSNCKLYKQVGNSISVNILAFLFKSIILTTNF